MLLALLRCILAAHPAILPYYFAFTTTIGDVPKQVFYVSDPATLQRLDRSRNAVWLEHRWLQEGASEQEITELCRRLSENNIRYVFPHLSPSDNEGRLPAFSIDAARRLRETMRRECPEVQILPWVGGVRAGYRQMREGTIHLESNQYLETFTQQCVYLTQGLSFDGIHINIEPVEAGNAQFLQWLSYIKNQIGEGKVLSVAANKPAFVDEMNISSLRSWDTGYFARTGGYCDQIVLMNYDTGILLPFFYSLYVHEKMRGILQRFSRDRLACKILIGVPTYDDAPHHSAAAENISSAIAGLNAVLSRRDVPKDNFDGVALYAYWTTTDAEWHEFSKEWLHGSKLLNSAH